MKVNNIKLVLIILSWILSFTITAQSYDRSALSHSKKQWFVSSGFGVQISGIKEEDFIITNIAPAISVTSGFWLAPAIGLELSYKGPYFNYIEDDDRHSYLFILAEVLFNVNEIVNGEKEMKNRWSFIIHSGQGYFYNYYFDQSKLNVNGGIINNVKLTDRLDVFMDISFVVGWDIYQGDEDILPSAVLGVSYLFK